MILARTCARFAEGSYREPDWPAGHSTVVAKRMLFPAATTCRTGKWGELRDVENFTLMLTRTRANVTVLWSPSRHPSTSQVKRGAAAAVAAATTRGIPGPRLLVSGGSLVRRAPALGGRGAGYSASAAIVVFLLRFPSFFVERVVATRRFSRSFSPACLLNLSDGVRSPGHRSLLFLCCAVCGCFF